jgi:SAM-dependent methyltransferase
VAFVEDTLGLVPGSSVLDLCCGTGRHAVLLAKRGFEVTAQDLSESYLERASRAAEAAGVGLSVAHSDMRNIPFEATFDAVINMFTAFGYLESEEEDSKVLREIAKALKPGGRFLLDLINREWVVSNYVQNEWRRTDDGTLYLEHRELDLVAGRNHVTFTVIDPNGVKREMDGHHVRVYTLTEVIGILKESGLEFECAYGGFSGEEYGVGTRRMIVVGKRPGPLAGPGT